MKKILAIGEALIDFIPSEKGCSLKDVVSFERVAGGAPANVGAAIAKLGVRQVLFHSWGKMLLVIISLKCFNKLV